MMKIAVMGAGAVGCYYGGMLARAGNEVTLIARQRHVDEIQRSGLLVETKEFKERVPVRASTSADGARGAELVLFCVKSTDTEDAGAQLAAHLDAAALVLSLQNGVDNAARLQPFLKARVAPAVVYVASEMAGPGHVKHHGRGELVVPPVVARFAESFSRAGVPLRTSEDVTGALWAKLIVNCAYNALSAVAQLPYGRLVQREGVAAVMRDAVEECLAVARAAEVAIPGDPHDFVPNIARSMPTQYSSTAQDLASGKRTEIDHLNGYVVRKGEALGVPTPVNRTLHTLVKLLEKP